ncbi:MAG: hypothetical protein ACLPPF_21300 [Rhodomicrobium sp.]
MAAGVAFLDRNAMRHSQALTDYRKLGHVVTEATRRGEMTMTDRMPDRLPLGALCMTLIFSLQAPIAYAQTPANSPTIVFMFCKSKGAVGIGQASSPQMAGIEATKSCIADGGDLDCCELVLNIDKYRCGAIAWDPLQGNRFTRGVGSTVDEAKAMTSQRCRSNNLNCSQIRAQCIHVNDEGDGGGG